MSNSEQFIEVRPALFHRSPGWPWECRAARRVPQAQRARRRWTPFLPCAMEPRSPHPRRPQALRRCLRAGLCAFGLLGGDPRRGLDLLGHFSEDHGKTSRSSHTSKEVDARWSTRATKHIGKEYLGDTREKNRAGERERSRNTSIYWPFKACERIVLPRTSMTTPPGAKGIPINKGASDE